MKQKDKEKVFRNKDDRKNSGKSEKQKRMRENKKENE